MAGWMDGWVGGWESRVKDCLQQSKTMNSLDVGTNGEEKVVKRLFFIMRQCM